MTEFYEDDEPVEDVIAAFDAGIKVVTSPPPTYGASVTVTSPVSTPDTPMVVTVCGSMRFKDLMLRVAEEATAAGWIVLMPHSVVAQQDQDGEFKAMLDRLHRAKIDLSQAIIVVSDETGYYGESTRGEIQYAKGTGKQVRYLSVATPSPVATPDTREAVSAEAIICAGVIVGVGGESDPCVTQEQADRATRLIVRELTKHGLLRPARATPTPVAEDGRDTAIRLLAEKQHRRYDSEFDASHLGWQDFAGSAAEDVDALLAAGWGPAVATDEPTKLIDVPEDSIDRETACPGVEHGGSGFVVDPWCAECARTAAVATDEQAVERAARAAFGSLHGDDWWNHGDTNRAAWRKAARAALDAAQSGGTQ